ncbi:FecCD family ABC transporter permease [Streptosporangium roseum]|uniref:Iron-enterobactin transporter membrane protein n=1 Tax=Streptosporangium roseum (strain ATCC 12428 / DSM 43021 / JCM 3005 / KCTC 9067 / NCIMB 10171 / NRRL 2505 / NI 9100) TaxID=479432 RepID=D2BA69_STRRD|nr:iron chelate uptake ABC transporter family permease subunit [Streptosporangium roseum]ACZ87894.1 iron-enterobactin transporter membrane protein [Streptosporangium roseum DSM 43021]
MTLATRATGTATTRSLVLVAGLAVLVVVAVVSVGVGSHSVAPVEVVRAFFSFDGSGDHTIVRDIRLPRAVVGIGVGAALGVAGVLIQTLSCNPLAEPGILGVTAGAGFAMTAGAALGLATSPGAELVLSSVGAALATLLVYSVGRTSPLRLVLTGVALSAVLAGISLGLRLMLPDVFDRYRFWSVGSLAGREKDPVFLPLLLIGLAVVVALLLSRPLNAVALGENVARALGANVNRVRLAALGCITVLAGAATAVAGPILFAGLIVPLAIRPLARSSIPWLTAYAAVFGPILLLVSDMGSRVLLPTGEVPVAIVTAFLGGPVLIWAVRRYGAGSL